MTTTSSLAIHLFGPMRVLVNGEPMPRVRTRSVQWLLALLVLRHERSTERSWLAGTLWPESIESQALKNLRDDLVRLRAALGNESHRLKSPSRDTLTLDVDGAGVDVVAFDRAIRAGDPEAAVNAYTGPLLEGCYEEWVLPERESRAAQCLQALDTLADRSRESGSHGAAAGYLRRAEALDPLRDSTARRLMETLEAAGDPAAAIEVYRRLRNRLHEELSVSPDQATTRLFYDIRARAKSRGEQAVKGPGVPERPVPMGQPPKLADRLSPPSFHAPPHPLTHLIGRDEEMSAIMDRLQRARLVTLVGAGGVGKTRIAMELSGLAETSLHTPVAWVDLGPLTEERLVLSTFSSALGLRDDGAPEPGALLSRISERVSESPVLIAVDNCEHLPDGVAMVVQQILQRCPGVRILATSRQRLGLTGEVVWRVPSLSVPEVESLPEDAATAAALALRSPAIQLFVERATSANADFQLARRQEVEAVCRICQRLDGIPLAIELAAARVRSLTVSDIHERLDQRFRLLTGGSAGTLPRHRTLRSLIDFSYDLLTEPEKAILCRLSVFSGGWTIAAAEEVCSELDALDLMSSLVDKSLVVAETAGETARYRLLETVRQYAKERLEESGETDAWRDRHLAYFLRLAKEANAYLVGEGQKVWLDRLEGEIDNLRAALEWASAAASASDQSIDRGLELGTELSVFWRVRGYLHEGRSWLSAMLAMEPALQESMFRAKALTAAAVLASRQSDYPASRALNLESLAIHRELGNRLGVAKVLNSLGNASNDLGDYSAARAYYEESLAIHRKLDARPGVAAVLGNLGVVAQEEGDYETARTLLEECIVLRKEQGERLGYATALGNLGIVMYKMGNYPAARALQEESLAIRRELRDRQGMALALGNLGIVVHEQGDYASARAHQAESLAIRKELDDRWGIAANLKELARVAALTDARLAASLWGAAERLREELHSRLPPTEVLPYESTLSAARAALADDAAFDAAWQEGRNMSLPRAIDLALHTNITPYDTSKLLQVANSQK